MLPNSPSHDLPQEQEAFPSFESLYDRYYVQIYRYLYAHLKNEHDAADLMQHVFFQAWKHQQTYNSGRGTIATWLLSIAHHRLVDFYRVSRSTISWESLPEISSMDPDPEAKVISEECIARVRKIIEALSQDEKELLAFRFAARLSSAEIAAMIGKSEAATKKQLTKLLQRLQERYRRQELEELIPGLLEPGQPAFVAALSQAYTVPLPVGHFQAIRQTLLEQAHIA